MAIRPDRIAAVLAGALLIVIASVAPAQAVYRGRDADFDKYRFMVSLRLAETPDQHRCGGTLIEPDVVLTAGHCVGRVPQGGLVAVVGADIPEWPAAPRVPTVGHRIPQTIGFPASNRDDVAVVRLAGPQPGPTVRLAAAEPRVRDRVVTVGFGATNRPPVAEVPATTLQASRQRVLPDSSCGTDVFSTILLDGPSTICTKGVRRDSTINRGDSGSALLVCGRHGEFLQVGVTSLGSDSTTKLYAGFSSVPVAAEWIAGAIESLRRTNGHRSPVSGKRCAGS